MQKYKPDFLCYDRIILEVKAVTSLADKHRAQVHNYLKATGYRLGLLANFSPDATIWRVNDKELWRNSFQVPKDPATLTFNAWSNGDTWTGTIPEGGVAYQQIQWIELLSGRVDGATCSSVCSVDGGEPGKAKQV